MITLAQLRILAARVFPDSPSDFPAMLAAWGISDPEHELGELLGKVGFAPVQMAAALKKFAGTLHREDREVMTFAISQASGGPVLGIHLLIALCDRTESRISRALCDAGLKLAALRECLTQQLQPEAGTLAQQGIVTGSETNPIVQYGRDLTALAQEGRFEDLCDRPEEIDRMLDVLLRRLKGNVALTGPAGVGKTALVELLARKIVRGEVPDSLTKTRLLEVNISRMVSGTKYRGDFEQRLHEVIQSIKALQPAIMFIDEMHLIWGAGRAEGVITDAANILKPFLARDDFRLIGATTVEEYQRYIARDSALARRFQEIRMEEADPELVMKMVSVQAQAIARHHHIEISEELIRHGINLTNRHLPNRWQPDKTVDLIDSSAAYAVRNKKSKLEVPDLLYVLAGQTGRPVTSLSAQDRSSLHELENNLKKYIIGQDHVLGKVALTLVCRRQDLGDSQKNLGTFLFAGETGVGKTETARVIARVFFGSESALLRLDLGEYNQPGNVNKLIGSPAGYVDSDQEGILVSWLQHRGSGVILLDEIEKASADTQNLLLGLLDTGRIRSARGVVMDARQCVIILTTNAITSADLERGGMGFGGKTLARDPVELLATHFPKEFITRIDDVLLFNHLGEAELRAILKLRLSEVLERLNNKGIRLICEEQRLLDYLLSELDKSKSGTRGVVRLLESRLIQPLSLALLGHSDASQFTLGERFYSEGRFD